MKVLGLLARKGGAGKTTLAIHLAVLAQESYARVLLVDLDPQRSTARWWRTRKAETPLLVETEPGDLKGILAAARAERMDLAVIDTRPSVEADAVQVATLADAIIIPTRPAILDLSAILETVSLVKQSGKARIVLNACPAPRGVGEAPAAADAREALKAYGVPVSPMSISHRAAYWHALVGGMVATETEPKGKAAQEMRSLWHYVEKELLR